MSSYTSTANVIFEKYGNTRLVREQVVPAERKIESPVIIISVLGSGYTDWVDTSYIN